MLVVPIRFGCWYLNFDVFVFFLLRILVFKEWYIVFWIIRKGDIKYFGNILCVKRSGNKMIISLAYFFFTIRFDILEICLGWVSLLQVLFPIPHFAACLGFFTVDRTSEFVPIYWQISNGRKWLTTNAWTYLSVGRMLWKIWDWEWWRMQLIFFLILKKTKKVFSSGIIDLMIHEAHTILFIKVQSIT